MRNAAEPIRTRQPDGPPPGQPGRRPPPGPPGRGCPPNTLHTAPLEVSLPRHYGPAAPPAGLAVSRGRPAQSGHGGHPSRFLHRRPKPCTQNHGSCELRPRTVLEMESATSQKWSGHVAGPASRVRRAGFGVRSRQECDETERSRSALRVRPRPRRAPALPPRRRLRALRVHALVSPLAVFPASSRESTVTGQADARRARARGHARPQPARCSP